MHPIQVPRHTQKHGLAREKVLPREGKTPTT